MMKKLFFSVVYLLLIMPFYGYGMGKDNESDWNRLISEGSNYIVRATSTVTIDGRKFQHFASLNKQKATDEMKKWFSDFVAYSIPTNDVESRPRIDPLTGCRHFDKNNSSKSGGKLRELQYFSKRHGNIPGFFGRVPCVPREEVFRS